jgi:ribosomal protein L25 (general stress protein Ctc)
MIKTELKELIKAMKMLIEAKTINLEIETKIDKIRLKDFIKHVEKQGLNMSDEDNSSWPDDFEEDWE